MDTNQSSTQSPRTIYHRSAEDGLYIGAYLSALALTTGLSSTFSVLTILVWAFSIYLPFYTYKLLRRSYAESNFNYRFVELWAQGIATYFLGSLILAIFVYICLRFIAPDYISSQIALTIDILRSAATPEATALADNLEKLTDAGMMPSAIDISSNMIVFNIFAGFIISCIDSAILKVRYTSEQKRQEYLQNQKHTSNK